MRRLVLVMLALTVGACSEPKDEALQGYVEGDFVLLAAPAGGTLVTLDVARGDKVEAGRRVFSLDDESETAARREAAERLRNAEARLANLRAASRGPEQEALAAQAEQARAAHELAAMEFKRQEKLYASNFISKAQLDAARTNLEREAARVAETEARARLARLSIGREAEIAAVAAEVDAARAALAQAEWRLARRSVRAPAGALVQDTFFRPGEWVPAGRPVVSLLPPGNVHVRFFVPETILGSLAPGQTVQVTCDGCPEPVTATIRFISAQAEYTPPVLYSRESRSKLVYRIEARPDPKAAASLRPGQPVDVVLNPRARVR